MISIHRYCDFPKTLISQTCIPVFIHPSEYHYTSDFKTEKECSIQWQCDQGYKLFILFFYHKTVKLIRTTCIALIWKGPSQVIIGYTRVELRGLPVWQIGWKREELAPFIGQSDCVTWSVRPAVRSAKPGAKPVRREHAAPFVVRKSIRLISFLPSQ